MPSTRWLLTQFFRDASNNLLPVAAAYGHQYRVPMLPYSDSGWALIEMYSGAHQLDAAKDDPRVVILPYLFDPSPLPDAVISAYAPFGATTGMSLAALLAMLSDTEPIFANML